MKFMSTKDLGVSPENIWQTAKQKQDIIITADGRPIAILTGVDENTFEQELEAIKRARALRALDMIHKESVQKGTYSISEEDIQAEIDSVRKGKPA
ncbi:MAG: type II toxin-antitoxin system Phd/YefM family antitoxin [Desulfococcaceae bacterium]|jgi:antitoxin (DNA-binding transcriptional repressor) of toxin-antitoxin stability system|nr:type II toxin-antitoxin system Phd/YefM family antitoxin [Desulfococcaceae bacterium]